MVDIIDKISKAKVDQRKFRKKKLVRRALKLSEECGEVAEAVFDITSKTQTKGKTWGDVREELTDVIIVATDMLLLQFPDEEYTDAESLQKIKARIDAEFDRKIKKWESKNVRRN